jgi:predicted secreted protein
MYINEKYITPIYKFYCDGENCSHSCGGYSGDGWNEPRELDWWCKKEDESAEKYKDVIVEWTDNSNDKQCPDFERITDKEIERRGW